MVPYPEVVVGAVNTGSVILDVDGVLLDQDGKLLGGKDVPAAYCRIVVVVRVVGRLEVAPELCEKASACCRAAPGSGTRCP